MQLYTNERESESDESEREMEAKHTSKLTFLLSPARAPPPLGVARRGFFAYVVNLVPLSFPLNLTPRLFATAVAPSGTEPPSCDRRELNSGTWAGGEIFVATAREIFDVRVSGGI
jgi:hypothetical protein